MKFLETLEVRINNDYLKEFQEAKIQVIEYSFISSK